MNVVQRSDGDANNNNGEFGAFQPQDLLLLFLGLKFQRSPLNHSWDFLTVQDLLKLRTLSKSIYTDLQWVDYTHCRDGCDYRVPFPGFPGLLATARDREINSGLFPHQLASLKRMYEMENNSESLHFGALRGGILGDAPGLGKTISTLSLIVSTAGQRPMNPPEFWTSSNLDDGYQAFRRNVACARDVRLALKPVWEYLDTRSNLYANYQRLERKVSPPLATDEFTSIQSYERYIKRALRETCGATSGQIELVRSNMVHIKAGLDKGNRKVLSSAKGRRLLQERGLLPSCATLVIVPDALLEHWFQQFLMHLDLVRFADPDEQFDGSSARGVIYLDGIGDIVDARMPLSASFRTDHRVLSSSEMSQYLIVVTSFSACKAEYRRLVDSGQLAEPTSFTSSSSSPRKKGGSRKRGRASAAAPLAVTGSDSSLTPLLQLRWLRLIVDEGHELGTHEAGSDVTRFIHEIAAERRWVLSGTPTTGNEDDEHFTSKALDQLQRLLVFLRHPVYGDIPTEENATATPEDGDDNQHDERKMHAKKQAKQQWDVVVKDPFLNKKHSGRDALFRVLKEIMVMHRKEDIHLPTPVFEQADVNVPIPEDVQAQIRETVDPLVARVYFDEYLHSEEYQILVDQAQADYIVETIRSARQALRDRGGPLESQQQGISDYNHMVTREDRRPIKTVVFSSNRNILLSVTEHLYRSLSFENIAELYGNAQIGDLGFELSRFRNGFKEQRICPICHRANDLEYKGSHLAKCQNILLEVIADDSSAIPHGQPRRFLIEPERILTAFVPNERMEGEPLSSYGQHRKFWRVADLLEVNTGDPHPVSARRESEDVWVEYGSKECKKRANDNHHLGSDWYMGPLPVVQGDRCCVQLVKWQKCSQFHGSWYVGPRLVDALPEKVQEDVFLLSLEQSLAVGLDLSFVTHMFLLEAIDDAALLEQVTSRAHRLGATGPVLIDTVNTFWKLPTETEQALEGTKATTASSMEANSLSLSSPTKMLQQEKEQALRKVVCQYCYRQFESIAVAEEHERSTCQRNPASVGVANPFHLSSIYENIRPPPALEADSIDSRST